MSRAGIIEKIRITGDLKLLSPLTISTGQSDGVIDSMVMRNGTGHAMIPGTSLSGVIRHIVANSCSRQDAELIFGCLQAEGDSVPHQSLITIDDVVLDQAEIVVRDGVAIDSVTGTAIRTGKYDYEAVDRGAVGKFQAELVIRKEEQDNREHIEALAKSIADQLAYGISLGAHTAKGMGQAKADNVAVAVYDFEKKQALSAWLLGQNAPAIYKASPKAMMGMENFHMEIILAFKSSLLVGAEPDIFREETAAKLDKVMLKSKKDFVIPGASVKGVVRKQAERICRMAGSYPPEFLNNLMGYVDRQGTKRKSRLKTYEIYFKNGIVAKNQTHVRIDRFTGGHMDSGLYTYQPVWQEKQGTPVLQMAMDVEKCTEAEAGLMLMVLKDIWTGEAAFGGDKATGSGILQGLEARIAYNGNRWQLRQGANGLQVSQGDAGSLEALAAEFVKAGV